MKQIMEIARIKQIEELPKIEEIQKIERNNFRSYDQDQSFFIVVTIILTPLAVFLLKILINCTRVAAGKMITGNHPAISIMISFIHNPNYDNK